MSVYNPGAGITWAPDPSGDVWKETGTRVNVMTPAFFTVAVDIGFAMDSTVISVIDVEKVTTENFKPGRFDPRQIGSTTVQHYTLLAQHAPKLGTPTLDLIRQLGAIIEALPHRPAPPLIVLDASGLGAPVIQMARAAGIKAIGLVITSGNAISIVGNDWRAGKQAIVSSLHQALVYERLRVANFQGREDLATELTAFSATTTKSGNPIFEAAAGFHDDRTLSLAMGVFASAHRPLPMRIVRLGY